MYQSNRSFNITPPPPGIPQAFDAFPWSNGEFINDVWLDVFIWNIPRIWRHVRVLSIINHMFTYTNLIQLQKHDRHYWKVKTVIWQFSQMWGHLNSFSAGENFSKNSNARGLPGGDVEASIWPVHKYIKQKKNWLSFLRALQAMQNICVLWARHFSFALEPYNALYLNLDSRPGQYRWVRTPKRIKCISGFRTSLSHIPHKNFSYGKTNTRSTSSDERYLPREKIRTKKIIIMFETGNISLEHFVRHFE